MDAFVRSPLWENEKPPSIVGMIPSPFQLSQVEKVLLLEDTDSVALLTAFPPISPGFLKRVSRESRAVGRAKRCDKFWKPVARQNRNLTVSCSLRFAT